MPELTSKIPSDCTGAEFDAFIAFVREGGEVANHGLADHIRAAAMLTFAYVEGALAGVAALKKPRDSYRERVGVSSGIDLSVADFPFELGWVYVSPQFRRKGISRLLAKAVLAERRGAGVFATSRADNASMHSTLIRTGFVASGNSYASRQGNHVLQVFLRYSAQPCGQLDLAQKNVQGQLP